MQKYDFVGNFGVDCLDEFCKCEKFKEKLILNKS